MAFDEKLAHRVRKFLANQKGIVEKKMFGGLAFLRKGKMFCGVLKDDLVLRVGPENYEVALARPYVRPMDFTGRPIKGFVFVGPNGCRTKRLLVNWLTEAEEYIKSLPKSVKRSRTKKGK